MTLKIDDVTQIAKFAHLHIQDEQVESFVSSLNTAKNSLQIMVSVDTKDISPMINPHDAKQKLRKDQASLTNQRDLLLSNAPLSEQGLFLVPRVIE